MLSEAREEGRSRRERFRNRTSRTVANRRGGPLTLATIRDIS